MTTRRFEDKNVRNIIRSGSSLLVSIPVEFASALKWKEKQKVVVKKIRGGIVIRDWKKH